MVLDVNKELNLKTIITISGVDYSFQILCIENGVLKRFILGNNEYSIIENKIVQPIPDRVISEPKLSSDWTVSEDKILIDNYQLLNVRKIIEKKLLPGRSSNSIYDRLHRLRLKKYKIRKNKNTSINFNQKILSHDYHNNIYEQCFNHLVFKLENMESFTNNILRKLIKEWYSNSLKQELKKSNIHNYEASYRNYGLDLGYFEKIGQGLYKIPSIVKKNGVNVKTIPDEITPVKNFTEHVKIRAKEIRDNERLLEKQSKNGG